MRRNPITLGLVAALAIGLVALPVLAATADVEIRDGLYHPASLTIERNTTVTWMNYDLVSHSVTSTGGVFDSGPIEQNETFDYTFADTGTYPYGCVINASTQRTPMEGVVIVVPEGMAVAPDENVTPGEEPASMTLAELVGQNENLTVFTEAIEKAGLAQAVLSEGGPYTVFAPDDAAFEALGNQTLTTIFNDTEMLDALLMHHVVEGNYTVEDLMAAANTTGNMTTLDTLAGNTINVTAVDGNLTIENATIVTADVAAENGIVNVIDRVLVPEGLIPAENVTPTPADNVTPPTEANVTIVEPMEGASVAAGNVTVSVNVTNFTLVEPTGQPNAPGEGHLHYYLDAPVPTNESEPAIPETGGYVVSANLSHTWENVTAGEHNLSVQVVNNDHTPLIPLVFETVNVTVDGNVTPVETVTPIGNITPVAPPEGRVIP